MDCAIFCTYIMTIFVV